MTRILRAGMAKRFCRRRLCRRFSCSFARLSPSETPPTATIDEAIWAQTRALREQHGDVLGDPQALARFLCGISSPRLARARLTRDPLFGSLGDVTFERVLARAREV